MEPATATTSLSVLEKFGEILSYPGDNFLALIDECQCAAVEVNPEAARYLSDFHAQVCGLAVEGVQELYVQTFDLNPICALEVGWQLYGDNYDRGNFLVRMRQELGRYGVLENTELPDHLSHVLPLIARMDPATAGSFSRASVIPAMNKMLAAFKGKNSPYENVLKALILILELLSSGPAQEANYV